MQGNPLDQPAPPPSANGADRPADEATDAELTRRIRLQDHDAYATLYRRHAGPVYSVSRSVLRDDAIAEEVVHDVFLNLWRQPQAYDPSRGNFQGWLLRVARNRSIDLLRQRRDVPFPTASRSHGGGDEGSAVDAISWIPDPDPDPSEQAVATTTAEAVRGALGTLPSEHRILLELAYFGGLTQREIALKVDRPLGTVKTQMRTSMRRLADVLKGERPQTSTADPDNVGWMGEGDQTRGPAQGRPYHTQQPNEGPPS